MSRGKTSHEFSGARAIERAKTVLEMYDSGVIDNIKIEIEESYEDIPSDGKDKDGDDTEMGSKDKVDLEPEEGEEQTEGGQEQDEEERHLGEISSGTTHQKVLYAIQRLDSQAPVEASRIEEWIESNLNNEVKRGSMFGALHDLYERRLIDREKNDQHNNEYQITVHGDDQLQKVGEP